MEIKDLVNNIDFDKLTIEQRLEVQKILEELKLRKKDYPILDFELLPHQKEIIDALAKRNPDGTPYYKYVIMMGGNGAGKCQKKGSYMLKYDGTFEKVENLKVGDLMMGPDSQPRIIEKIGNGVGQLYKLTPYGGEPIYINGEHQLYLVQRRRNRKGCRVQNGLEYAPEGELIQISVDEYLKKSDRWKKEAQLWQPNIINYQEKKLKIDPYILGLWLGDGSSIKTTIYNIDNEVIEYIKDFSNKNNLNFRYERIDCIITGHNRKNQLLENLKGYNLINNKHIPLDYLTTTKEDRLELLAGLIDTDGYKDRQSFEITQKSEILARHILQLGRSLGFRCSIAEVKKSWIYKGEKKEGIYYSVRINGNTWIIPTKIKRKQILEKPRYKNKDWRVQGFKIEPDTIDEYYGFELSGDHLYLDYNFNVQHNTIVGGYAMTCKMLGKDGAKYNLPYLGTSIKNKVVTSTGTQIIENIEPYILGGAEEGDLLKIPPEELSGKPSYERQVLKGFKLKNGAKLTTGTYDQGMTRLQGGTPSFLWLDEIPERWKDFDELTKRTRDKYGQFLITFTPTNYNKKIYDWIHHEASEEEIELYGEGRKFFIQVDALLNTKANHSHMIGKSDEDLQIIRFGKFVPPSGLVYKSFNRDDNVIPFINPKKLGSRVRFYGAVDFGVKHPLAFLFIAVDDDGHIYVFDMIYGKNILMKDLHNMIEKKKEEYGIELKHISADSAGAREALELKSYGTKVTGVNKRKKEGNMSNRRGGIMRINQYLNLGKIIISDTCKDLINEFENHHYAENGEDGSVKKENDDALDALRYFVFSYSERSVKKELKKTRRKIAKKAQKARKY